MLHLRFLSAFSLLLSLAFAACQNDGEGVQEIRGNGPNANIIRNPISAEYPLDTNKLARIVFEQETFNFNKVKEGTQVEHLFKFTNTGKVPLVISNCRSSCGCTIPEWPKEEIAPGESGEIKATFNTFDRPGNQRKRIYITANTYPNETTVVIEGEVIPAKKKQ